MKLTNIRLLTVEQAAEAMQISRAKLYQMIRRGEVPSILIGNCRRIAEEDLARWLSDQRHYNTSTTDRMDSGRRG